MSKDWIKLVLGAVTGDAPVLIAGPTASGKSALAMAIAAKTGGPVVNADALQVYSDWRILTARPSKTDEATIPHALYGHVPGADAYSVGHWLRDVSRYLSGPPPVIVGGTGLYFTALTEGLADIPPTPLSVREQADKKLRETGLDGLLSELDDATISRIDTNNPARVQRAWEVLRTTGRGLAGWQDDTGPALLPSASAQKFVFHAPKTWLNPRIEQRLDIMLRDGALAEAEENAPNWHPKLPSAKAIGATELVAVVSGEMELETAKSRIVTLTRQYAKRQRSWFRGRMSDWIWLDPTV